MSNREEKLVQKTGREEQIDNIKNVKRKIRKDREREKKNRDG